MSNRHVFTPADRAKGGSRSRKTTRKPISMSAKITQRQATLMTNFIIDKARNGDLTSILYCLRKLDDENKNH